MSPNPQNPAVGSHFRGIAERPLAIEPPSWLVSDPNFAVAALAYSVEVRSTLRHRRWVDDFYDPR
jgi:hypothetical protein